jgi:ABC-type nickel/cobalt efflux system permease component RcnA
MRVSRLIVFFLLILASTSLAAHAQKSPFGVPGPGAAQSAPPPAAAPGSAAERPSPALVQRLWVQLLTIQRDLHRRLAAAVQKLKSDGGFAAAWLLASLSFVYGVVHAVGPGHGKAVISSYVLANERTVRRGVALSFVSSAAQAVSAIALVGILAVMLNAAGLRIKEMTSQLETASYALVALVGAWLLASQLRRIFGGRASHAHAHTHGHAHDEECCGHAHMPDPSRLEGELSWRKAAAIVFAVGIRPCTGAVIVLVFALANGLFLAGVAATFAMALGTAITVSALAAMAVGSKQLALRFAGDRGNWSVWIANAAGLGGSLLVLLLGATLFAGSLGPARPF